MLAWGSVIGWMQCCYYGPCGGGPASAGPCGVTPEGLPVGLQIVGRHRDDWGLLQMAHAFAGAKSG